MEIDDITIVDRNVRFEIPQTKVGILTIPTSEVQIGVGFTKTVLHPTKCRVETEAGPNLTNENYLKPQRKCCVKRVYSSKLRIAPKEVIEIQGVITLVVQIGDLHGQMWFEMVRNLVGKLFFGTMYSNKFICSIFPTEQKVVPDHLKSITPLRRATEANVTTKVSCEAPIDEQTKREMI